MTKSTLAITKFSKLFVIGIFLITQIACSNQKSNEEASNDPESNEQALIEKAMAIHDEVLTIDTHADTPLRMIQPGFDMGEKHDPNETGSKVDYPRMVDGGLDGIFFAAFVAQGIRDDEGNAGAKTLCLQMIDSIIASTEKYSEMVGLALTPDDAYRLEKEGKRAIYIGIENGYPIGDEIENVQTYFDKGVRYITLVHSSNNDLADSATDDKGAEHGGISDFGYQVVREMNRLGIMVDVSHGDDSVFYDAIKASQAPIIASHSNARSVTDSPRNMTDAMLKLMAENGGVVQLTMLTSYLMDVPENPEKEAAIDALREKYAAPDELSDEEKEAAREEFRAIEKQFPSPSANVSHVVDHIDHIVKIAGINHVGIGCDFDGGGGIDGIFDVSEVKNITIELVRRGYSKEEITKIWGGNIMRVFKEVAETAKKIQAGELASN